MRERARARKLILACNAAADEAMGGASAQRCIDGMAEALLEIQSESEDAPAERVLAFTDAVYADWQRIVDSDREIIGLTTGINSLDLVTTGIRQGELWVIGGRTGDGKSSLALQIAAANLRQGISVGLFSLEMSRAEVLQRLWAHQGNIPFQQIRDPRRMDRDTRARVKKAMADVGMWPLFVQDGSLSIQRLQAKERLLIRRERVGLIIVDYLQIVTAPARDERERLTRISNCQRELAKSEGVPVLAICQLNRPKDGSLNARPNKFSLKESGSLENDAHTILLTYRPVDEADRYTGLDTIIVAKQRHGPVSLEPVRFDSKTLAFFERELRH